MLPDGKTGPVHSDKWAIFQFDDDVLGKKSFDYGIDDLSSRSRVNSFKIFSSNAIVLAFYKLVDRSRYLVRTFN